MRGAAGRFALACGCEPVGGHGFNRAASVGKSLHPNRILADDLAGHVHLFLLEPAPKDTRDLLTAQIHPNPGTLSPGDNTAFQCCCVLL